MNFKYEETNIRWSKCHGTNFVYYRTLSTMVHSISFEKINLAKLIKDDISSNINFLLQKNFLSNKLRQRKF